MKYRLVEKRKTLPMITVSDTVSNLKYSYTHNFFEADLNLRLNLPDWGEVYFCFGISGDTLAKNCYYYRADNNCLDLNAESFNQFFKDLGVLASLKPGSDIEIGTLELDNLEALLQESDPIKFKTIKDSCSSLLKQYVVKICFGDDAEFQKERETFISLNGNKIPRRI